MNHIRAPKSLLSLDNPLHVPCSSAPVKTEPILRAAAAHMSAVMCAPGVRQWAAQYSGWSEWPAGGLTLIRAVYKAFSPTWPQCVGPGAKQLINTHHVIPQQAPRQLFPACPEEMASSHHRCAFYTGRWWSEYRERGLLLRMDSRKGLSLSAREVGSA